MSQPSHEQLNKYCLHFNDGSLVKLTIPEAVGELMRDDCVVVGGYIRDAIAKLLASGRQIVLSNQQQQFLSEKKLVPQEYLPQDRPFVDIDIITKTSAAKIQERGFKSTLLPGYYVARRGDKKLGKIIKIGVTIREESTIETDIKNRDFYSNTFLMDKSGVVYDISGMALLGVLTKVLMIISSNPVATFAQDFIKFLRALYFQARDSYTFEPLLDKGIHEFANDAKELQKSWDKVPKSRRFSATTSSLISATTAIAPTTTQATTLNTTLSSSRTTTATTACTTLTSTMELATSLSFFDSKEIKYSKAILPIHICMCDYIGGPIYPISREEFFTLAVELVPTDAMNLNSTNMEYGCCYCGYVEGWKVCRRDAMAKINLEIPAPNEIIHFYLAGKTSSKLIAINNLSRLLTWKNLMSGQAICCNDDNKRIIILPHDVMLQVFKQTKNSRSKIIIPQEKYAIISFLEWEKQVERNYANTLLASCNFFQQQQQSDSAAPISIVAILNTLLDIYAFWRYEQGTYSCHIDDYTGETLTTYLSKYKFAGDIAIEPCDDSGWEIRLSGINVEKLVQAAKKATTERQTPKSRCCNLSNCIIL